MDIIGHLAVIEHAATAGSEVWEEDAVLALFPNLAHCHEWAYGRLKEAVQRQDEQPVDRAAKLIEGHIITDWVIHYGPTLTPEPQRIGWAYQEMHLAVDRMDGFFDNALRLGITDRDPRDHDTRAHLERDFGHTSVECALDFRVGSHVADSVRENGLRQSLARLGDPAFGRNLAAEVFSGTGGYTKEPDSLLARTMGEYGDWASSIEHPEDFAALTLCTKFDWPYDRRTVDYVLEFLHGIERELDHDLAEQLVDEVVAAIADPRRMSMTV
ncbi:hypothetical protein GCM10010193_29170 [Kitasatospora atroaurantiaca]|uniref:Uncharacterized protein n=1 Tax=Kitasatospora atroaurantiaca TaxID=285545 RepID=A0A561EIT7_9ACTN|nr:hypothetical protein [Kitasatospora atroaurantiaca]TWE15531.1 hypothetical protein FB465_0431 [Kitasatospora atroaurantiaca]